MHLEALKTLRELVLEKVISLAHDHTDADKVDKSELVVISEHRVPQADHIAYFKLLTQQQHQPSQGIVLRV